MHHNIVKLAEEISSRVQVISPGNLDIVMAKKNWRQFVSYDNKNPSIGNCGNLVIPSIFAVIPLLCSNSDALNQSNLRNFSAYVLSILIGGNVSSAVQVEAWRISGVRGLSLARCMQISGLVQRISLCWF